LLMRPDQKWYDLTLNDVCTKITDGAHLSPPSVDTGLPMASVKDLTSFGINLDSCRKISKEDFDKLIRQGCQPIAGDVLIAKDGATALDTVCVMKETLDVVLLSSVAILRPDKTQILPSFLRYYLDSETTRSYMKGAFTTGAAIPRVVLKDFKLAPIKLPPLPTQRKIAAILSAYDDLIENNTRRIKILEEMASALYREWFVNFRFPGHEKVLMEESELGPKPEGWEVKPIGEIIETLGGGTPSKKIFDFWDDGDIIWYTPSDLTSNGAMFISNSNSKITPLGLKKSSSKLFPPYSVMMTSRATIGIVSINTISACTNQGFITCVPNNKLSMYLVYFWILENKEKIITLASGATFKEINKSTFRKLPIVIPDELIHEQFSDSVGPLFEQIRVLLAKNENIQRTRDFLLPKLISGEIDVEGLEIEGAEA